MLTLCSPFNFFIKGYGMIFKPQIWINSVLDIDEDFLDKYNIKALVLDLDNTLSMHGNPAAENGIPEWLEHMKNIGVPMRIVSNNTNKRVAPFAKKLGLPFTANGCKPLTFGISKAIKIMGVPKKQVAVVGDQIFTDVIAGNIKGAVSVLVEPFHMESAWTFKLKRKAESLFFHRDYSKLETKEKK